MGYRCNPEPNQLTLTNTVGEAFSLESKKNWGKRVERAARSGLWARPTGEVDIRIRRTSADLTLARKGPTLSKFGALSTVSGHVQTLSDTVDTGFEPCVFSGGFGRCRRAEGRWATLAG